MSTRKVWESESGHKRVAQSNDGTLYELTKDLSSNTVIAGKKIDVERLWDLRGDRPSGQALAAAIYRPYIPKIVEVRVRRKAFRTESSFLTVLPLVVGCGLGLWCLFDSTTDPMAPGVWIGIGFFITFVIAIVSWFRHRYEDVTIHKCSECDKEVNSYEKTCPRCGIPYWKPWRPDEG